MAPFGPTEGFLGIFIKVLFMNLFENFHLSDVYQPIVSVYQPIKNYFISCNTCLHNFEL